MKIGDSVIYFSKTMRQWPSVITKIYDRNYLGIPVVDLEFRNERNKLVRKIHVIPFGWKGYDASYNWNRGTWMTL